MTRRRIALRGPHRGEVGPEDDVVRKEEGTPGKRRVPVQSEVGAVDRARGSSPMRSLPQGSLVGPPSVPVSSTGFVTPLIVRSPVTITESPCAWIDVETKRSSGYRCVSKNSGDWR